MSVGKEDNGFFFWTLGFTTANKPNLNFEGGLLSFNIARRREAEGLEPQVFFLFSFLSFFFFNFTERGILCFAVVLLSALAAKMMVGEVEVKERPRPSPDYLMQLLNEKKLMTSLPNLCGIFTHLERLLDEGKRRCGATRGIRGK